MRHHLPYYHVPSPFIIVNFFFHILTNTKFVHVTSTYYHSWNLVFEFTINGTYFHRVSDIQCMRSYLVYLTQNIIFSVVATPTTNLTRWATCIVTWSISYRWYHLPTCHGFRANMCPSSTYMLRPHGSTPNPPLTYPTTHLGPACATGPCIGAFGKPSQLHYRMIETLGTRLRTSCILGVFINHSCIYGNKCKLTRLIDGLRRS
jgi:hypothetical protein